MRCTALISLLLAAGAVAAPAAQAADLLDAYRLALRNDPQIHVAEANFRAEKEAKPQAWAQYLPQINASAQWSDTNGESSGEQIFSGVVFPSNIPDEQTERTSFGLRLTQTVFDWGRIQQFAIADATVAQADATYRAAQQALIIRVAEAYFNVLAALDTLESARANREAIGQQLEQTKKRYEVGLIAITDVQESQAAYDQAVADEIAAERQVIVAREALRVITGEYMQDLAAPGEDMPLVLPEPAEAEAWVKTALNQNLDLIAARFGLEAAYERVDQSRAGHLPTLNLSASYNDSETESSQTSLSNGVPSSELGNFESQSRTIGLELAVPIFSGGATSSRVREAAARATAAHAELQRATRTAQQQARSSYLGVTSEMSRVKALRQAVQSAETALKATRAGFEVGTRTTVDVLVAQRNLFTARTDYARARYDYILNLLRLKQAAGLLDVEDLQEINGWLQ